ncbi:MAG: hypothetical protein LAO09_15990 [Acidobacteriia bacterium]|nr:hypothetical protein [Terriglobia bacterium]
MTRKVMPFQYLVGLAARPVFCTIVLFAAIVGLVSTASAQASETVLYSFQGGSDGYVPVGSIAFDKAGNLYGATTYTSPCVTSFQCGSVYELSPPPQQGGAWTQTTLYTFQGHSKGDGGAPTGGLIQDAAGNLYGVTGYGGTGPCILLGTPTGCGAVYEMIRPAQPGGVWKEKVLYSFLGNQDGQFPFGDLVFDKQGNLYGATWFGGGKGDTCNSLYPYCGTIFQLSPPRTTHKGSAWTEKVLYSFQGLDAGDGGEPNGGLVFDESGNIYGTTSVGGSNVPLCNNGCGTAFELVRSPKGGPWTEQLLYSFLNYPDDDGARPNGNPILINGTFYGTTLGGGEDEVGTVFSLTPPPQNEGAWTETLIHVFTRGDDGASPSALIVGPDRKFYGSSGSGPSRYGLIYRMDPPKQKGDAWKFVTAYNFTGPPDGVYAVALKFGKNNTLYGTTSYGGTGSCNGGCGTVFEIAH